MGLASFNRARRKQAETVKVEETQPKPKQKKETTKK